MIKLKVMDYHTLYNHNEGYYIIPVEGEQVIVDDEVFDVDEFHYDETREAYVLFYNGTEEEVTPLVVVGKPQE